MEAKIRLAAKKRLLKGIAGHEQSEGERSHAEQDLREVHERFESAFGNAPIGMALIDMDGSWLQVNGALCRITGYSQSGLRTTTLRALTHPDDVDLDLSLLQQLIEGRIPIAEFVGDADTARLLRNSGVDYAQGYHIGPPLPVTEVLSVESQESDDLPAWESLSRSRAPTGLRDMRSNLF